MPCRDSVKQQIKRRGLFNELILLQSPVFFIDSNEKYFASSSVYVVAAVAVAFDLERTDSSKKSKRREMNDWIPCFFLNAVEYKILSFTESVV